MELKQNRGEPKLASAIDTMRQLDLYYKSLIERDKAIKQWAEALSEETTPIKDLTNKQN